MRSIFEDQRLTLADGVHRLESTGIAYMLTGSVAMVQFVMGRMTNDIDIVVELSHGQRSKFIEAFESDYYVPTEKISGAIDRHSMFNVLSNETLIKIDIALIKDTAFHRHAFEQREKVRIWEVDLWSIRRDDLIVSKLYWAKDSRSERQIRDVAGMMLHGFDLEYVREWSRILGIEDLLDESMSLSEK